MNASSWISIVAAAVAVASLPLTIVATRSTTSHARLAGRQTELQEQIRRDAAQPYVWADLQPDDAQGQLIRPVVCNEGPTVATQVQIVFDPPLQAISEPERLTDVQRRLSSGLQALAPGRRLQWTVDIAHQVYGGVMPLKYRVRIGGLGPFGRLPPLEYDIDLGDLTESADAPRGSLHEVAKSLGELTKAIKK